VATGEHAPLDQLSFITCLTDEAVIESNLLRSPCLSASSPHEIIVARNAPSAASALKLGLQRAGQAWVVCVHQDVRLAEGWDCHVMNQLAEAQRRFGPVGVAGVYGVGAASATQPTGASLSAQRSGLVVDRGRLLRHGSDLPARVATLDELLLILPRDTPLRFDPALGFHLYGADICLQAAERGLPVVVLQALCHHNSRNIGLPRSFFASAEVFARKWAHRLPIATPCVVFDGQGQMYVLGNAPEHGPPIASAIGGPLLPMRGAR
jgi:Glycosyltransferase like family